MTSEDTRPAGRVSRPSLVPSGIVAGRCRLLRQLGKGGMGEVWLAEHLSLRIKVAVKFLNEETASAASTEAHERFLFEAQVSALLATETNSIVRVHDAGRDADGPYMIMEYVEGRSLERMIDDDGPIAPAKVLEIVEQLGEALTVAHGRGIIHRDLKPANVLLSIEPSGRTRAKLADFGIAKSTGVGATLDRPAETVEGMLIGSPDYMSPEQQRGSRDLDARSDVWSLGVVAYEALTGKLPFDAPTVTDVVIAVISRDPAPVTTVRPGLPAALDAWFARALAKDRDERFPSITQAVTALRAAIAPASIRPPVTRPPLSSRGTLSMSVSGKPPAPLARRSPLRPLILAGAGLLLLGTIWALEGRSTRTVAVAASLPAAPVLKQPPPSVEVAPPRPAASPRAAAASVAAPARPGPSAVRRPSSAPTGPKDPSSVF